MLVVCDDRIILKSIRIKHAPTGEPTKIRRGYMTNKSISCGADYCPSLTKQHTWNGTRRACRGKTEFRARGSTVGPTGVVVARDTQEQQGQHQSVTGQSHHCQQAHNTKARTNKPTTNESYTAHQLTLAYYLGVVNMYIDALLRILVLVWRASGGVGI